MTVDAGTGSAARRGEAFTCRVATGTDGADYVLFAGVDRAGTRLWLEVDSANLDSLRLAPHAAHAFGLSGGTSDAEAIEFALGEMKPVKTAVRVVDLIYDGAINASFLERGILFADLRRSPHCRWAPHE